MIITYKLDTEKDHITLINCMHHARDMGYILWEFMGNTRKDIRMELESMTENGKQPSPSEVVDLVYQRMKELLDNHNIDPELITF